MNFQVGDKVVVWENYYPEEGVVKLVVSKARVVVELKDDYYTIPVTQVRKVWEES